MPNNTPIQPTTQQNQCATLEACKAITFHPCTRIEDFLKPQHEIAFPPLFTHAFFPDELLTGWLHCKIRIFFTTDTFDVYVDVDGVPAAVSADLQGVVVPSAAVGDGSSSMGLASMGGSGATSGVWDDLKSKAIATLKQHLCSKVPFAGGFCDSREVFLELLKPTVKSQFVPCGEFYAEVKFVHTAEDKQQSLKSTKLSSADHKNSNTVEVVKVNNKPALDAGIETLYLYKSVFAPVVTDSSHSGSAAVGNNLSPATAESGTTTEVAALRLEPDERMQRVHRRVEWFLHFFIDACSSIEYDQRWRVFFAYVKRSTAALSHNEQSSTAPPTYQRGKRQRNEALLSHSVNDHWALSDDRVTVEQQQLHASHRNPSHETTTSKAEHSTYYEFLGFTSLYKFFALPKCRLRLSQFFVLPTYQSLGLGVALLHIVHKMTLLEADVMEFAVEDPAPAFKQLRDIVSMQLALDNGIICSDHLYPPKGNQENNTEASSNDAQVVKDAAFSKNEQPATKDHPTADSSQAPSQNNTLPDGDSSSASEDEEDVLWGDFETEVYTKLRLQNKESLWQAQRIVNLLRFARVVPQPIPTNTVDQAPAVTDETKNVETHTGIPTGISALLPVRTGGTVSATKSPQSKRSRVLTSSAAAACDTTLVVPPSVPPPVAYLLGRNWRYTEHTTQQVTAAQCSGAAATSECFMSSDAMRKYRLRTKRQLRAANIEWIGALSGGAAKQELHALWTQTYMSFCRTLCKLRKRHGTSA